MKIKITVEAVYDLPEEFKLNEEDQYIFHKDSPGVAYIPDGHINFHELEPNAEDVCESLPDHLQGKFDEGWSESTSIMKPI